MKDSGGFDEHQEGLAWREVLAQEGEQFPAAGRAHRQILFAAETLVGTAQGDPDFVLGGIEAEEVGWFH